VSARRFSTGLIGAVLLALPAWSGSQPLPDLERGRALYQNHCVVCHTSKVHRREPPLPITLDELRAIVTLWAKEEGLPWRRDEIEDVVQYLDRAHYRFAK
jgi:mono/diheme cytochrome c family protein